MSAIRHEIRKTLTRRYFVAFACPHCRSPIKADPNDAGIETACPDCGGGFVVPGDRESLEAQQATDNIERQQKDHQKEQARRAKEAEKARAAIAEGADRSKPPKRASLLHAVMGNATEVAADAVTDDVKQLLLSDERVERSFKFVRDWIVFTNRRLLLVDKQGITGKKVEYHSLPYKSISHFSIETAGHLDLDAELKVYLSGVAAPLERKFKRGSSLKEVQQTLVAFTTRLPDWAHARRLQIESLVSGCFVVKRRCVPRRRA